MCDQAELSAVSGPGTNTALENIALRLSNLEKSVAEQNKSLHNLKYVNDEISQRVSVLHESVANKEKIMEARARICNDRVFLIEAAAGRKDDVFSAIETLFKTSQNTSERISALERTVADIQVHMFGNKSDTGISCQDEVSIKHNNHHRDLSQFSPNKSPTIPPSQIVQNICEELYGSISLPGVRFVGQGRNWFHRYLWVLLHLTTFSISFNYIKEAYDTWQDSPVVLSLNNSLTRVADIPFPAFTLCSLPSVSNDYNITQQVSKCFVCTDVSTAGFCQLSDKCNDEDVSAIAAAVALCNCRQELTLNQEEFINEILMNNLTGIDQLSTEIKNKILPRCDAHHVFMGEPPDHEYSCQHVHTTIMEFTDTPMCFTFNSICPRHLYNDHVIPATLDDRRVTCKMSDTNLTWNTDNMMEFANKNDSFPLYREKRIEIMFQKPKNSRVDTCNEGNDANSKIGIHQPGEVPMEENTRFYSFRTDREINIYVSPTLITAQKDLRHYEPSVRGCYFSQEKNLTLFKFYTRKNCQMECKANCSLAVCKCIPNFLPRQNSSIRVCHSRSDEFCVQYTLKDSDLSTTRACRCDCLPDCVSLSYDFTIDDAEIDPKDKDKNFTRITIKYKDLEFSSKIRYELRNLADFIADSGGFLGVFNGFSFMVVFELFYFLTIRLWSSIKKSWMLAADEQFPHTSTYH